MTLEFSVINQRITSPRTNYYVVADSVNYLKIDFQFTQDWQGFSKIITFRNGQLVVSIEVSEDNSCIVPWEVIKYPSFIFSIVGMKDGVLITTDVMKVVVKASGDKDGCEPKPPTRQFYEGLAGGEENQILFKNSDDDFDYKWGNLQDASYDGVHTFKEIIDSKQDVIQFIRIAEPEGTFDEDILALINDYPVNKLVYNNVVYYSSIIDRPFRKYFSTDMSSINNEIDVNINTGYYKIVSKVDPLVQSHIDNEAIHIKDFERQYWNNKVTAYTELDEENDDFSLILTKENI